MAINESETTKILINKINDIFKSGEKFPKLDSNVFIMDMLKVLYTQLAGSCMPDNIYIDIKNYFGELYVIDTA